MAIDVEEVLSCGGRHGSSCFHVFTLHFPLQRIKMIEDGYAVSYDII